jgi:hypothetical protein
MRVTITRQPTGLLNGAPWPGRGGVVELPDHVAETMRDAGLVEYAVPEPADVEHATPPAPPETRPAPAAAVETREEAKPRGGKRGRPARTSGSD